MPSIPAVPQQRNQLRPVKYHVADTFWCTYIISVTSANIAELGMPEFANHASNQVYQFN